MRGSMLDSPTNEGLNCLTAFTGSKVIIRTGKAAKVKEHTSLLLSHFTYCIFNPWLDAQAPLIDCCYKIDAEQFSVRDEALESIHGNVPRCGATIPETLVSPKHNKSKKTILTSVFETKH